jgi:hypothetical protein
MSSTARDPSTGAPSPPQASRSRSSRRRRAPTTPNRALRPTGSRPRTRASFGARITFSIPRRTGSPRRNAFYPSWVRSARAIYPPSSTSSVPTAMPTACIRVGPARRPPPTSRGACGIFSKPSPRRQAERPSCTPSAATSRRTPSTRRASAAFRSFSRIRLLKSASTFPNRGRWQRCGSTRGEAKWRASLAPSIATGS